MSEEQASAVTNIYINVNLVFYLQDAQAFAEENNLIFTESSAKTGMCVGDIFMAIGTQGFKLLTFVSLHTCFVYIDLGLQGVFIFNSV